MIGLEDNLWGTDDFLVKIQVGLTKCGDFIDEGFRKVFGSSRAIFRGLV